MAGKIALVVAFFVFAVFGLVKLYEKLSKRKKKKTEEETESLVNMNGKVVIVTGANTGIGKMTAKELARRNAKVILACRNLKAANIAKEEIIRETNNQNVLVKELDLSSLKSVRSFAADINKTETKLDVLIHNAGVAYSFQKLVTEDALDMTMATNHFGPFLLTHLLIDLLKKSEAARIIIVASELYRLTLKFNVRMINPVNFWLPAYLYYYSKYVNILFTLELAKRLENTNITVNCLHPGMIDSGIWRNVTFPLNLVIMPIVKILFKTPEEGCRTTVNCAVAPELDKVTGKYFMDSKIHELKDYVKDMAVAKKVWELSEKYVNLQNTDPKI